MERTHNHHQLARLSLAALLVCAGCAEESVSPVEELSLGRPAGEHPPTARPDTVAHFRADMEAVRHPSDGGGSVALVLGDGDDGSVTASGLRSWTFRFTAGPDGIQPGGALYFQTSPFWGWSTPQTLRPFQPGYTTVALVDRAEDDVLSLEPITLGPNLMAVQVGERDLEEGEILELVFGAGEALARGDRHAEEGSTFWFAVDGDGDGVRELLEDCPRVNVHAGPPSHLVLTLTSVVRPGERPRLTAALLDATASTGVQVEGGLEVQLHSADGAAGPSLTIAFDGTGGGRRTIALDPLAAGVWRATGTITLDDEVLRATSNPLLCDADARRVRWGDLHGHSQLTDGTGTPDAFYTYAREVAMLDFCALTDHDHWGMRFVDQHEEIWEGLQRVTNAHDEPGVFVTIVGYEWTSWIHGHRHVLSFTDSAPMLSSLSEETDDPAELWEALRGTPSMTLAHHSAGGPIATNWDFAPDPVLEPITEVMSVHGSSEAMDSPSLIYSPLAGNFVRDVLDEGYEFGFIASGDSHDGHPGLPHLSPYYSYRFATDTRPAQLGTGGLAAVFTEELSRGALLEAMRARATYATSGPRLLLDASLGEEPMGTRISPHEGELELSVSIHASAPLRALELVRSGAVVEDLTPKGPELDLDHTFTLKGLSQGEYVYLRIQQMDGGLAWSSPWFITEAEASGR